MLDIWYTFPATMGDDQAWISYNHGYAEIADADPRNNILRVRLPFKNPTEHGMPTNEEFPHLTSVDEALDDQISASGGVYVGSVTVDGHRFFYFYLDTTEKKAAEIVESVSDSRSYKLQYVYETDKEKKYYWNELYPTDDDWQIIQDLKVLDSLDTEGDIREKVREVMHWAYFPKASQCQTFTNWVRSENYVVHHSGKENDGSEYLTQYSHNGTMHLGDITNHTIRSNRKARELGGRYDGWETSVERE